MNINFNHSLNQHTISGAKAALAIIFGDSVPNSLLDVGCGTGQWVAAAVDLGTKEVFGIDGVNIPGSQLLFPLIAFAQRDLTVEFDLGRRFEMALCLEVAEHLPESHAATLIKNLVRHSDTIVFSAACPNQKGQNHVNCQWPKYWQKIFNDNGYSCDSEIRRTLWEIEEIEPWYRQNILIARRRPDYAGKEPRILPVLHPDLYRLQPTREIEKDHSSFRRQIEEGLMPSSWYLLTPLRALLRKLFRKVS